MTTATPKGDYNGLCNRTACQRPYATWFNQSTRRYYCPQCAVLLNSLNKADAQRLFGGPLCVPDRAATTESGGGV